MAKNGYSSGGSYNSPDKAVETSVRRQLLKDVANGSASNLQNMNVADIHDPLVNASNSLNQFSKLTEEETNRFEQHVESLINSASSATEAFNAVSAFITKFASQNVNAMKSIQQVRSTDPNNKGEIGVVVSSNEQISIHLQQEILKMLQNNNNLLGEMNKDAKKDRTFQEELFEALGQNITHSFFKSPTVTKLGDLGSSLISAGFFKIASNENAPSWLRQGAMGAVYMEVPQTLMNILGATVQTTMSMWMAQTGSKLLGDALKNIATQAGSAMSGFMSNAGSLITKALPVAVPLILAGAGIYALIKGIIDHKKNMKDNDARIASDPTLTQGQKDVKRLGAHTASGAKTGAISGALIGAAIGTVIAPGIGTAIGGAIGGGALGGALGGLIGSLKPLGAMMKHGLSSLGGKIMSGAKWARDNQDRIMAKIKPVLDIVSKVLETAFPFFTFMRLIFSKIANSGWFKKLVGGDDGGDSPNTVYNPGESGGVGRNFERAFNKGSTSYTKDDKGRTYLGGHLITSGYGWRIHPTGTGSKMDGKKQFHRGIDLAYGLNEKVGSFTSGKVIFAGKRSGYGNTVEILDDNGVVHKYHHGSSIPAAVLQAAKTGGRVNKGDVIMKAGKEGYATGVHLDYETWKDGNHVNPLEYLGQLAEQEARAEKEKKEKEAQEKKKKEEENKKEHPILNNIKEGVNNSVNRFKDLTGMDDFTENITNPVVNKGGPK